MEKSVPTLAFNGKEQSPLSLYTRRQACTTSIFFHSRGHSLIGGASHCHCEGYGFESRWSRLLFRVWSYDKTRPQNSHEKVENTEGLAKEYWDSFKDPFKSDSLTVCLNILVEVHGSRSSEYKLTGTFVFPVAIRNCTVQFETSATRRYVFSGNRFH